jgi:hypothetical protein
MVALVLALFGPCDNYTSLLAFAFTKRMLRAKVSEIALLYTYSICQVLAATSMCHGREGDKWHGRTAGKASIRWREEKGTVAYAERSKIPGHQLT